MVVVVGRRGIGVFRVVGALRRRLLLRVRRRMYFMILGGCLLRVMMVMVMMMCMIRMKKGRDGVRRMIERMIGREAGCKYSFTT